MTPGRAGRHPAARLSADARRRALAPGRGPPLLHRDRRVASRPPTYWRGRWRWTARSARAGRCATASTPGGSTARSPTARARREALREFAAERGIDLEQSWAYTDAASDLPMLEAVGHPVAVNPDAGLAEVARARGLGGAALREARPAAADRRRGAGRGRGRRQRQLARGAAPGARRSAAVCGRGSVRPSPTIQLTRMAVEPEAIRRAHEWLKEVYARQPERDALFTTISGEPVKPLYTEEDLAENDPERDIGYPGRVPVHARRLPVDVPRAAVDDAPVRRLRHRRGDQRALPLPARPRPDRASRPRSTCRR